MSRRPAKQFDPDQALHQAMTVFWAKGYVGSSLSDLLEAMGISRKSLYDTFGSKRALFIRALDLYAEQIIGDFVDLLNAGGSPLINLQRALEHIADANDNTVSSGCLIGVGMSQFRSDDPEISAILHNHLQTFENACYRVLDRVFKVEERNPQTNSRDLARMLTATAQGLMLIRRTNENPEISRSIIRATIATFDALSCPSRTRL